MTVEKNFEDKRPDETLGAFLLRVRESRNLTVEQLASATRLSKVNLLAIEKSDWKALPGDAYARSYLNTICRNYGLDTKAVLDIYEAERNGVRLNAAPKTILPPVEKKPVPKVNPANASASQNQVAPAEVKKPEPVVVKVDTSRVAAKPSTPAPSPSLQNAAPKNPIFEEEAPKKSSAAIIVVVILFVIACAVALFVLNDKGTISLKKKDAVEPAAAVLDTAVENTEMPEGAILADTAAVAVAQAPSKAHLTQAEVDEALKKSGRPASATIFISSSSKKETAPVATAPVSDNGKTKVELIGSGKMTTWVGLRYDEEDDEFVKEANLTNPGDKLVYNAKGTLYVTIGESRAIEKMILNGVETPVPPAKFGRVVRFRIYDGRVLP